jgi:predicted glycoside hydrolase/deacetylase ChbG (UPF0249 family)
MTILALCADDFGLSDGVDLGIIDLIERGRISAASCMMAGPSLDANAPRLLALSSHADIGLHLTFTDLAFLGDVDCLGGREPPSLNALMIAAFTGRLKRADIRAEIARQIARFGAVFGRLPDFIDGHQHSHVLPVIRQALFDCVRDGLLPAGTAIRNCSEPALSVIRRGIEVPKSLLISGLSAGLARQAHALGMPVNDSFRGITAFATDGSFARLFPDFLVGPGDRPLAMCHPALAGYPAHPTDVIAAARVQEHAYLAGDAFAADLTTAGVTIGRHGRGG